jgi:hypothetical protein
LAYAASILRHLQAAKRSDVTLSSPPKVTAFSSYWGPHVPLEDGENPETRAVIKKAAGNQATLDPTALLALIPTLMEATRAANAHPSTNDGMDDKKLTSFILENEALFPEVIDFLGTLKKAEESRGNGRDWVAYSDALTKIGCLHLGHVFILVLKNESALENRVGMALATADYFALKVRAECSRIMHCSGH